ncbi:hypothetical protein BV898_19793 [Hypsibius exemplaris]|uniref:Uncharacterized protein n=1 Tax=Hypsibius exemplaris TaxID=2072580 RepID=A0A9X6NJQ3_HYPEX|nr:hypothetical protein BV898_19793 [Hypsibius exemplaris]
MNNSDESETGLEVCEFLSVCSELGRAEPVGGGIVEPNSRSVVVACSAGNRCACGTPSDCVDGSSKAWSFAQTTRLDSHVGVHPAWMASVGAGLVASAVRRMGRGEVAVHATTNLDVGVPPSCFFIPTRELSARCGMAHGCGPWALCPLVLVGRRYQISDARRRVGCVVGGGMWCVCGGLCGTRAFSQGRRG